MATDALVREDLDQGAALVRALDDAKFPILAAVWMYNPDNETWRLVLATPSAKNLRQAYVEIREIAERAGTRGPDLARIKLVQPSDPTIATLSKAMRIEGLSGVRLSQNMIDGLYIDDAYIYRTAA